jgi:hypothetical protein
MIAQNLNAHDTILALDELKRRLDPRHAESRSSQSGRRGEHPPRDGKPTSPRSQLPILSETADTSAGAPSIGNLLA